MFIALLPMMVVGNTVYYFWNQASSDPDQSNRLKRSILVFLLKSEKNLPHGEDNGILPEQSNVERPRYGECFRSYFVRCVFIHSSNACNILNGQGRHVMRQWVKRYGVLLMGKTNQITFRRAINCVDVFFYLVRLVTSRLVYVRTISDHTDV